MESSNINNNEEINKLVRWPEGSAAGGGGGTVAVFNSRVAGVGGGMAGRKKRREKRVGVSGWCGIGGGKCMISLAALWCCSPCCHTSKREQIKGSSFDEYKTESPAEKHSPSLPF